jgi:hypothetical protein
VLFVRKRDRIRLIIGCRRGSEDEIHCSYHLYARQHQETDVVTITSLYSEHACFTTIPPQRLAVSYVKRLMVIIPELIQVTSKTTTKDIKSVLQRKEHQVSLQQCQKVKRHLLSVDRVARMANFEKISAYAKRL